ncbi:cysteine synthase family protein [Enterococcus sp.]|uniref:PLP-dependent cysteine synthase family protein n=1 Tax=Enterococcus sp. TaxID=35783 RepID=UPI0028AB40C0|nr:cysteine synthase family protein [Enterococcus sp.]
MIIKNIKELIGNTPLFAFDAAALGGKPGSQIFAKLEYLNPGGSIKDRLGLKLIHQAFLDGEIDRHTTIIEPTAGNTGIGMALAGLEYGLKMIFVIPEKFSVEKQQLIRGLGAQIVHTATEEGIQGAIEKAKALAKDIPNSYLPLQFHNEKNPAAYSSTLGPEIFQALHGKIDSFVAGVGSGGTFAGVSAYLLKQKANIRLIAVEPEGSILNGGPAHGHEIEGIGVEFVPRFFDQLSFDTVDTISDEEGFRFTRHLAKAYGLLVGSSSGAAMASAVKESWRLPAGSQIVTLFPDSGDRYLSKQIYEGRSDLYVEGGNEDAF